MMFELPILGHTEWPRPKPQPFSGQSAASASRRRGAAVSPRVCRIAASAVRSRSTSKTAGSSR